MEQENYKEEYDATQEQNNELSQEATQEPTAKESANEAIESAPEEPQDSKLNQEIVKRRKLEGDIAVLKKELKALSARLSDLAK